MASLDGLTFAVKDLIDVDGCRTGGGNPDWLAQQNPAPRSAPVVEKRACGRRHADRQDRDRRTRLQPRRAQRASRPPGQSGVPGPASRRFVKRIGGRGCRDDWWISPSAPTPAARCACRQISSVCSAFGRAMARSRSMASCRLRRPTIRSAGSPATPKRWRTSAMSLLPPQEHPPITNLTLADDAFALVDPLLAAELKTRAAGFGPTGSVGVFDGKEADYFECYRVLQGAEIWQSLGTWITRHKPRFADDIAAAICQHRGDHAATTSRTMHRSAPRSGTESKSLSRRTPQLSCR